MKSKEIVGVHALVYGHVQGVGFRSTVYRCAQDLRLKGSVENLSDGSVEVYAQGSREKLSELFITLKSPLQAGFVERIEADYYPRCKDFQGFEIIY